MIGSDRCSTTTAWADDHHVAYITTSVTTCRKGSAIPTGRRGRAGRGRAPAPTYS
jgi:hypothetical protein